MIKIVLETFENTIFKLVVTALHCVLETMLGWIFFKVLGLGQTDKQSTLPHSTRHGLRTFSLSFVFCNLVMTFGNNFSLENILHDSHFTAKD